MSNDSGFAQTPRVVWGVFLVLGGTALLLDNLGVLNLGSVWDHWPLIIVAIGIGKLLGATRPHDRGSGLWWVFIGSWLYVSIRHLWDLSFSTSWPILLIGIGVSLVWKSFRRASSRATSSITSTEDKPSEQGEHS
ncbi:MAG: hypothetical protein HY563_02655 [Ignavibacteriales bacterium]|nr:hypothetical protein [Ignavibacteriales bacterium]